MHLQPAKILDITMERDPQPSQPKKILDITIGSFAARAAPPKIPTTRGFHQNGQHMSGNRDINVVVSIVLRVM